MIKHRDMPLLTRLMPLANINNETRTAEVVWTTGAGVRRFDFSSNRHFVEVLSLEAAHVDMTRLESGNAPVLNSHSGFGIESVLGVVERATLTPPVATLRFSKRAEVTPIFDDVQDKIIRNVSVGYKVNTFEMTPPTDGMGDWIYTATSWTPMEISLCPIGADAGATFRAQPGAVISSCAFIDKQHNATDTRAQGIRERVQMGGLGREFGERLINSGNDFDICCRQIVDAIAAKQPQTPMGLLTMQTNTLEAPTQVRAMTDMLVARLSGGAVSEQARQYSGLRLVDMGRQILEQNGVRTTGLSVNEIFQRGATISDFTGLLSDTGNRLLRKGYDSYKGGLKQCARAITSPDFRAINRLNLSETPKLLKVLENAEIKSGSMTESKASYSLSTYARIFGLSRQAMINDDLGAFGQLAVKYGRAAAEFEAQNLVDLLTSNLTLADGVALFHSTHGNKSASPGAISVTTLGAAKAAMRLQKGLDGLTPIDCTPAYLIVPAALETVALQYLTQLTPALSTSVNPFAGQLQLIVDPRLDAVSATVWYLAADPATIDTIEYAYLESAPGLQIETRLGFEVEGMEMKCRLDFGSSIYEHRGLYQNA